MKSVMRAKMTLIRTMLTTALATALFTVLAVSDEAQVMTATGWSGFKLQMTNFFYNGLGGEGAQAIGMVVMVCGVVLAVISFIVHKINPQSRMPGWFTCILIAVIGSLLIGGVEPALEIIEKIRDIVFGWFGFTKFGTYTP